MNDAVAGKVKEFLDTCAVQATEQQRLQPDCPFYHVSNARVVDGTIKWAITEYPKVTIEPFGGSQILVQRKEWQQTPSHEMFATSYAPAEHYQRIEDMGLTQLDGDYQIADGFDLLLTPGHTHGGQSAVVTTSEGTYVIAGMCVLKENFYPSEEEAEHFKVIPPGGHTDLFQAYEQMVRLKQLGGDNVLPLHMTEAFDMGRIGSLSD